MSNPNQTVGPTKRKIKTKVSNGVLEEAVVTVSWKNATLKIAIYKDNEAGYVLTVDNSKEYAIYVLDEGEYLSEK